MDLSIGNVMNMPLSDILNRGMKDKWLGPYRDECIIGENFDFIKFHNDSVAEHLKDTPLLPVPYEKGFELAEAARKGNEKEHLPFPSIVNVTKEAKA